MSLDVYLTMGEDRIEECPRCGGKGFINHGPDEVHWANITHNLNTMAGEAGLYEALWRPDEIGITKAKQLIPILMKGLSLLLSYSERFEEFDASNRWGTYDSLVGFVKEYLQACESYPDADVSVSR